ncbi:MAG: hypothetical protein ACUVX9_00785 [Anaerolineae bacterium]
MPPYDYYKLTPEQRAEVVAQRLALGYPPHSPPHPFPNQIHYLISAACYRHAKHMSCESRRQQLLGGLLEACVRDGIGIRAWVVLPNHYHLLVSTPDLKEMA